MRAVRVQNSKLDLAKLRRDYYVRDLPFGFYCLQFTLLKYKLWREHKMENLNNITTPAMSKRKSLPSS